MDTTNMCPGCEKPLAPNVPDGLCPACLIKAGAGTGVDIGLDSQDESRRTSFVAPTLEEVARLFPQLEILGFIGQGGMGAVYKTRQKALDRVVALKLLPPGIGKDPAFAERFTREAKALARLNHPGVVTIHEFGQADGLFFFLMEFVDGMSLRHLLEIERISAREALAIVPQICDALQYAHDHGIVHRDIKPENILLDRQGRVKVADFGLAKLVGTEVHSPLPSHPIGESGPATPGEGTGPPAGLTDAGKVMGTPQYMAPEQREHPTEVDHRADIYSLGVVFYQMLTGQLPGKPLEPPSSRMHGMQIDVRIDEVVLRALEKEPQRRYQQVSEVKTAVETIAQSPALEEASLPSRQEREICAHLTQAERRELATRGRLFGVWVSATCFGPVLAVVFMSKPVGWYVAVVAALVGLAGLPIWRRMLREFLCSTAWAKQEAITPERLVSARPNWRMPMGFLGLCVPSTLFAWFTLTGHRVLGIDLDADEQFWIGLIGFPFSAGMGALLAWLAGMFRAPNGVPSNDKANSWSSRAIAAVLLWIVSVVLLGGGMVLFSLGIQTTHQKGYWRPSLDELNFVWILCGGGLIAATSATIMGWAARKQMQRTPMGLRGWGWAWAATWFWPGVTQGLILLCFLGLILTGHGRLSPESNDLPSATTVSGNSAAQIARLKLEQAQAALVRAKASYDLGKASLTEYQTAQLAKDLAEAELSGDTAAILRANLRFTEEQLLQAESRFKAGVATQAEVERAKLAKDVAEARLSGDGKAIGQAELKLAQQDLMEAETRFKVGRATQAEVERAKLAKDVAEARLSGDGKAK